MKVWMLAGLLAATAVSARADDETVREANRADVRCVIGMSVMSRNEQYKSWGALGVFFFSGRVEGREPGIDLERAIKREVSQMRLADYQPEIQRCSALLGEKSRAFEAMKPPAPRGVGR
ncbi:MAG: hypothetical protein KKE02_04635 [Alphaproteobacteria bacterium]|nr:hypothetical protein [Alphaproteobacteria bacterium]MBU1513707.1 hypothetical protein [Alphaproteobacteria bacterium]MBU2094648.1 hypothetical protein [Alphaproteobacteria bacterium]MBU2150283.1 hypothetical protein [Alphaproteobacteria bacterium]MBU2309188.1 hypothetical protein [Alphaproteobacteria bacterium]